MPKLKHSLYGILYCKQGAIVDYVENFIEEINKKADRDITRLGSTLAYYMDVRDIIGNEEVESSRNR